MLVLGCGEISTKNKAERIVHVESLLRSGRLEPGDGQVPQIREKRRSLMGGSIISILSVSLYSFALHSDHEEVVIIVQNKFILSFIVGVGQTNPRVTVSG